MRVIAGTARSLPLKTVEGTDTRPTTDRIKETLFNMLQTDITGARFLDLFSGSGAIAIEALSRGAKEAVLVENNRNAIACIKDNLRFTKLDSKAVVCEMDVISAINRLDKHEVFDIIFIDAPYGQGYEKNVLEVLKDTSLADEYTIIIIEEALDKDLSYIDEDFGYEIYKIKKYKTNKHVFVKRV